MKLLDFWVVGWELTKFLMSYLKPQVSFSLTLHHSSMSWEMNLLYFFSWNFIWFLKREPTKVQKTLDCSGEISPNLNFDRFLLLKVYEISAKKVQKSYVSWYWRVVQNLNKNQFLVSKMTRIWWIDPSTKKSKMFSLWLVPFVQSM